MPSLHIKRKIEVSLDPYIRHISHFISLLDKRQRKVMKVDFLTDKNFTGLIKKTFHLVTKVFASTKLVMTGNVFADKVFADKDSIIILLRS